MFALLGPNAYLGYPTPGVITMGVAAGAMSTSIAVCQDMTEGIINRFRTMNITRSSFMTGHVVDRALTTLVGLVLVVGVAVVLVLQHDLARNSGSSEVTQPPGLRRSRVTSVS
ncbi:hypothetical protein ABZZ04_20235 [Streptomyces sp. NPDC006435]|uniref:hypothetical protein n=1 Tax=Streptomyces sp. NPDC006435 TaxID=3154300 RepID=UPI0033B84EAF